MCIPKKTESICLHKNLYTNIHSSIVPKSQKTVNHQKCLPTVDFPGAPMVKTAGGTGSTPGQGTKIPHAAQYHQKKKFIT